MIEFFRKTNSSSDLEEIFEALLVTANILSYKTRNFMIENKLYVYFERTDKKYQLSISKDTGSLVMYGDYGHVGKEIVEDANLRDVFKMIVEEL